VIKMHDAWKDKLENPDDWVERPDLKIFLKMEGSHKTFNDWLIEIESLEDNYLYIQGTLATNETYNKVRIYNYINAKRSVNKREKRLKKGA
jgi:hypothetical protein